MKIKALIFDFGFTLFYFDNPSVERYNECFKKGLLKSIESSKSFSFKDSMSKKEPSLLFLVVEGSLYLSKFW